MPSLPERWSTHPYAAPFRSLFVDERLPLGDAYPEHAALDQAFERARVARFPEEPALAFVSSPPKSKRRKKRQEPIDVSTFYDARITRERTVPTRANDVHDFCNFLAWLAFPRAKRAIHARQLAALERWIVPGTRRVPGARTREQDALTLFDEGGVILFGEGCRDLRVGPLAGSVRAIAFGHALLEHFALRETSIAATAIVLNDVPDDLRDVDAFPDVLDLLDRRLAEQVTSASRFNAPGLDALVMLAGDGHVTVLPPMQGAAGDHSPSLGGVHAVAAS